MTKIMLIEDDATMLSLLQTLLEMEGYTIAPWDLQADVRTALLAEHPDLILLDVNLKGLDKTRPKGADGFEILRLIRSESSLAGSRVIMSSGMDYREQCLQAGADAFLLKPYMPDDLIALIEAHLS